MEQYLVTGMSCAACQARVEKAVSAVPGVESCAVSLLTNSMGVEGTAPADDIIKAVEKAGYGARVKGGNAGQKAAASGAAGAALFINETAGIVLLSTGADITPLSAADAGALIALARNAVLMLIGLAAEFVVLPAGVRDSFSLS